MDLDLTPTTSTKSPDDSEIDTPPHPHPHTQTTNFLSFTNGAPKNHHHPPPPPPPAVPTYKECMKNHAAAIGGHAVDGCGEFMPSSATDPTSLKCAACGCHRNFHRREHDSPATPITPPFLDFRHPPLPQRSSLSPSPPPSLYPPHSLLTLSTAVATEEQLHHPAPVTPIGANPVGKKRFRTKFTQEQKEKMQSFSEKLGWKIQKCDENSIQQFCKEIGVTKGVLKVWMHNNKSTTVKKELGNRGSIINGGIISFVDDEGIRKNNNGSHCQINGSEGKLLFLGSNNGSSSSA